MAVTQHVVVARTLTVNNCHRFQYHTAVLIFVVCEQWQHTTMAITSRTDFRDACFGSRVVTEIAVGPFGLFFLMIHSVLDRNKITLWSQITLIHKTIHPSSASVYKSRQILWKKSLQLKCSKNVLSAYVKNVTCDSL